MLTAEQKAKFAATLLVDKPIGWTSFDVVNKLRFAARDITGMKKIKVGHAGTLDPLATGLLIVCVGKATKQIDTFLGLDKAYEGKMKLGATTPSFDLETEEDSTFPIEHISDAAINDVATKFKGWIDQVPPQYSAKKVDGKKAYEMARKGKHTELKPARVEIKQLTLCRTHPSELSFEMVCSKGTYVRSLARDVGLALGSGAYLTALRRTSIGDWSIGEAHGIEGAIEALKIDFENFSASHS